MTLRLTQYLPSQLSSEILGTLKTLTLDVSDSDMNRTLRDIHEGKGLDPILRVVLAHHEGRIVGWATAELWALRSRLLPLINIFVEPSCRRQGVGAALRQRAQELMTQLIDTLEEPRRSAVRQNYSGYASDNSEWCYRTSRLASCLNSSIRDLWCTPAPCCFGSWPSTL